MALVIGMLMLQAVSVWCSIGSATGAVQKNVDLANFAHSEQQLTEYAFNPDSLHTSDWARAAEVEGLSLEDYLARIFENKPAKGFSQGATELKFLLQNNTATEEYFIVFRPEKPAWHYDNYTISFTSSAPHVLNASDIRIVSVVEDETVDFPEIRAWNITIEMDFYEYVGITNVSLVATPGDTLPDTAVTYTSTPVEITAGGFVFYTPPDPFSPTNPTNQVVTGPGRGNILTPNADGGAGEGLNNFGVLVQFLNGSTSSEITVDFGAITNPAVITQDTVIISYNGASCEIDGGTWTGTSMTLQVGCGYGFNGNTSPGSTYFALQLSQLRNGQFQILFTWPDFETEEFTEDYQNYYEAVVTGSDVPVVVAIEPPGPFRTSGGETMTFSMFGTQGSQNLRYNVTNAALGEVYTFTFVSNTDDGDGTETVIFTTAPGRGQNLPWTMEVLINGTYVLALDLTGGYLFSYYETPELISIIPDRTDQEQGGITVTLNGSFPGFNPAAGDRIRFDLIEINSSDIISFTDTEIVFTLPPRTAFSETDYTFQVDVVVGSIPTNSLPFYFTPLDVIIFVTGAAPVEGSTTDYEFTDGGTVTTTAITTGNTQNITYQWEIIGPDGLPYTIPGLDTTAGSISFTYNDLGPEGRYIIRVTVTNAFGSTATAEIGLIKLESGLVQIIVDVIPLQGSRTRAFPNAGIEINALVQVLNGPPNAELDYEWTYGDLTFFFTPNSTSSDNTSTVARFGRVLFIPQKDVFPSLDLITVTCTATLVSDRSISGNDTEQISVVESELVAEINDGSEFTQLSASTASFTLSGLNSYDPDILRSDIDNGASRNEGLTYNWLSCEKSLQENFIESEDCNGLLPQASTPSFALTSSDFNAEQLSTTAPTYFRFSLEVTKEGLGGNLRRSRPAELTIQRLVDVTQDFSRLDSISVTTVNEPEREVDLLAVNPLEGLVITPTSSIPGTQWTFEFIEPLGLEEMTVTQIDNGVGYYDGINPSSNPMLLLPGALVNSEQFPGLDWRTRFVLEIRHSSPTTEENTDRIVLQTISQPQVILNPLSITSGNENTIFSATAFSDFDGDQSILRYRFYWERDGTSFCVNGCSGDFTVQFQITTSGTYNFRVELWDATGATLFDNETSAQPIQITTTNDNILELSNQELDDCFLLGDHSCVEEVAFNLATFLTSSRSLRKEMESSWTLQTASGVAIRQTDEEVTAVVANALDKVERSSGNSFPTTNLIETYYEICQKFGVLSTRVISQSEMLTNLLLILLNVRERKENGIVVSTESVNLLRNLYPALPEIAVFLGQNERSLGTSRRRLLQNPNDQNVNLANVYSSQSDDIVFAASDNEQCGFFQLISIVPNDAGNGGVPSLPTDFFISIRCSQAQNEADPIVAGSNSLSICPEVFGAGLRKLGFHLVSSPDYPYLSGFDESDTSADARQIPQLYIDQSVNELPDDLPSDCFQLTIQADLSNANGSTNVALAPFEYEPLRVVGEPIPEQGLYNRVDSGATPLDTVVANDTVRSVIAVPGAGLYGTTISGLAVTPTPTEVGGGTPTPSGSGDLGTPTQTSSGGGISGGAIAGIVVGILVFLIIAILIAWLIATRCFVVVAPPVQEGFEYVERDIYGRGFVVEQSVFSDGSMVESQMGASQMSPA